MPYDEQSFGKMKGAFFKSMKEENIKCLEPNEQCQDILIKSHSVQDSRILEHLADNQHVCVLGMDMSEISKSKLNQYAEPQVEFKTLSIHDATTFKGLCNHHDTEMFKPIDTEVLDMTNQEHTFLLTYRAVLKELSTLIATSKMMQNTFLEKVNLGVISGDEPTIEGIIPVMQMQKAFECYEYKKKYDEIYLSKDFDQLFVQTIVLPEKANFAVSSIFTPMEMSIKQEDEDTERIGINIFPYDNKTFVIFSCLKEDEVAMKNYTYDILNATGVYQKYLLSKTVLRNCENIVFSPKYVNSFSDEKKQNIIKYFKDTCFSDKMDYDSEHIYLF